jgi:glutathione S-transferase
MIKLYDFPLSGHAHKARLMLSLLDIKYERIEVALAKGEQRSEHFLALNPFHHVPVLEDDGLVIRDSNAIITYLAKKYGADWFPNDAESSARIQEWLAVSTKEVSEGFCGYAKNGGWFSRIKLIFKFIEFHLLNEYTEH